MDNILTCGNCGARMRIKPATVKLVKEVKCVKCHGAITVPDEMRDAARNGTLQAPPPTVRQPPSRKVTAPKAPHRKPVAPKPASTRPPKAPKPAAMADTGVPKPLMQESSSSSRRTVRRPVVITRKKQAEKKPVSLDPPVNTGKPMRPKTIVAPPPSSAPLTVAPAASGGGVDDAVSSATVKLMPKDEVASVQAAAKPATVSPVAAPAAPKPAVRLSAAAAQAPRVVQQPPSPAQAVAQIAAQGPAGIHMPASEDPIVKQALADIAALRERLDGLEGGGIEARLSALEKATVSMTTVQQDGADDLADLIDRFESLKATVSKIDNRLACLLKIYLDQSQHLAVELTHI